MLTTSALPIQDKFTKPMIIRMEEINKRYGAGDTLVNALEDVNLTIEEGE